MAKRNWKMMKVDADFKKWVEDFKKQNQISEREATKMVLDSLNMMKGKKKLKRKIEEEISF